MVTVISADVVFGGRLGGGGGFGGSSFYSAPGFSGSSGSFGGGGFGGRPSSSYGAPGFSGYSGGGSDGGQPTPYNFHYAVRDAVSGNDYKQQESSDGHTVQGEYRVRLPDGRNQIVRYRADDATGFNADVQYEGEPSYPSGGGGGYGGFGGHGATSNTYLPPRYK
ncbi:hypothetical protein Cfor_07013 [Coptotermes formosanus]|uniref:Cuticular protein n=1 Tax=Coptotermes formosanus TaxID=36987 RepID=A0A6L2Q7B0_COPFO|nr:hypothetical protein Cfor_07013 [Coptotermes formosanus]